MLAEGINLHRSNIIINYDLPWNPTRVLQRVGRVNRVGTQHDKVYVFNIFPTAQSDAHLGLEDNIKGKIQAFHNTLGEDAKYLSDDEELSTHELFGERLYRKLNDKQTFEDDQEVDSELRYLKEIRNTRFDYRVFFSEVFRENGGFDIVIANPPYVGAVQAARENQKQVREQYKKIYDVSGAFDLYVLFLLQGYQLLAQNGQCAFIIPNKFKIADYAKNTFDSLKDKSQLTIVDVSTFEVFKDVGVYPIVLLSFKAPDRYYRDVKVDSFKQLEGRQYQNNHFETTLPSIKDCHIKVRSGLTGFQAKAVVPFICAEKNLTGVEDAIPFLVSGCVDPYNVDMNKVRYMGQTYIKPHIINNDEIAASKWYMWLQPKIVIAGMTKRIEAFYSQQPLAIGVGCYAVTDFHTYDPWLLLGIFNSKLMTYYLINMFKDKHLQGGYLAINKSTIESLPLPRQLVHSEKLSDAAKRLQTLADPKEKTALEKQVNACVYNLYGLTPEEIAIVEEAVSG